MEVRYGILLDEVGLCNEIRMDEKIKICFWIFAVASLP
jgi:hypothetical protein